MRGVRTLAKTQTNIYSRSPSQIYFMASQAHCLIFIHSQAGFLAFLLNLIACAQMQATGSRFANSGLNNSGRLKRRVPQLGSDSQETRRVLCKARMKFSALAFGFEELAGAGLDQSASEQDVAKWRVNRAPAARHSRQRGPGFLQRRPDRSWGGRGCPG